MTSERDLRWNFLAALIDAAGWGLGMGLVSATTFLPMFVRELSGSTLAVGTISAAMTLGWYVPGIFVARSIERMARVKRYVIGLALTERFFLLLIVPLIYVCGKEHRGAALSGFLVCWFLMNVAMGCNSPSYYKLIAKTIPPERRGRLYGVGGALAGLLGVGAGLIAGEFIARWGYPHGYALCFLAAVFVLVATVIPLGFMREEFTTRSLSLAGDTEIQRKDGESTLKAVLCASSEAGASSDRRERVVNRRFRRRESPSSVPSPWKALQHDASLRWLTISHILFGGSLMASGFFADYAIVRFHAGPRTVGQFTSVMMASTVLASLLCGWLGDRQGNKRVLQLATGCGAAAALCAAMAPSLAFFYPLFVLNQIATTGWGIAAFNLLMELGGQERAATYTAVSTLLTGPFKAGMPLLGAVLIRGLGGTDGSWLLAPGSWPGLSAVANRLSDGFGYAPVFLFAAAITVTGLFALTRGVRDPRAASATASEEPGARSQEPRAPCAAHTAEEGVAA